MTERFYRNPETTVPPYWSNWIACQGNPIRYFDPDGLALYAFDGTNNNMNDPSKGKMTNIGYLFNAYIGLKFYYEGVGTGNRADFVAGGLTGFGGSERLMRAYSRLTAVYNSGDHIIDVIGFSRGAALGRAFVNVLAKYGIQTENGVVYPKVRFLGLFDTVASFGKPGDDINRGIELGIPKNVMKVRHAIALDEYRGTFPLTSIMSDPGDIDPVGWKIEKGFRGAHSDIGGGYSNNALSIWPLLWMHSEAGGLFGPLNFSGFSRPGTARIHDSRYFTDKLLFGFRPYRKVYYHP